MTLFVSVFIVERWRVVDWWNGGLVGWEEAEMSGRVDRAEAKEWAVVIIYLGGVEFFFANAIERWCEELPRWFRNNQ